MKYIIGRSGNLLPCFLLVICLIIMQLFSCKKGKEKEEDPQAPPEESRTYVTGLSITTKAELEGISFIEDLDSGAYKQFARFANEPAHFLDGLPPIGDQGNIPSCVGFTLGHSLATYYANKMGSPRYLGSASYLHNQTGTGSRGSTFGAALKVMQEKGVCDARIMPSTWEFSEKPTSIAHDDAKDYTISDYHFFKTIDLELIKHLICLGHPIPFGININDNTIKRLLPTTPDFQTIDDRLIWTYNTVTDKPSQHAMLIVGYDNKYNAFLVKNSWSERWAQNGYIWISYKIFQERVMHNEGFYQIVWVNPRTVVTEKITKIQSTTATVSAKVLNDKATPIVQRGVCWSATVKRPEITEPYKSNGSGVGEYKVDITNLLPNTKYYTRAYGKKGTGAYTYGNIDSFVTTMPKVAYEGAVINKTVLQYKKDEIKALKLVNQDGAAIEDIAYDKLSISASSNAKVTATLVKQTNGFTLGLKTTSSSSEKTAVIVFYDSKPIDTLNAQTYQQALHVIYTNGTVPAPVIDFKHKISKSFTLANEAGVATGLDYTKLELKNNTNPSVDVNYTRQTGFFTITYVPKLTPALLQASFDVYYDGIKVQTMTGTVSDSLDYYKSLISGNWVNESFLRASDADRIGTRYDETFMSLNADGTGKKTHRTAENFYFDYSTETQSSFHQIEWSITYEAGEYYMSFWDLYRRLPYKGRITPALAYTYFTTGFRAVMKKQ